MKFYFGYVGGGTIRVIAFVIETVYNLNSFT